MSGKNIAIVMTSHDKMGDTDDKTGFWWEEMCGPYKVFKAAGANITLASVKGGKPPADPGSAADNFMTDAVKAFQADEAAMRALETTTAVADLKAADLDAVFFAGGHGTCWDFDDAAVTKLVEEMYAADKVIGTVCHGPTALVKAKKPDGTPLVAGKTVTGFTDEEEKQVQKEKVVPYLLESKLKELQADFKHGDAWANFAVTDGKLITGQNPTSSERAAELTVAAL